MIYVLVVIMNVHTQGGLWAVRNTTDPVAVFDNRIECERARDEIVNTYRTFDANAPIGDTMITTAVCHVFKLNDWKPNK